MEQHHGSDSQSMYHDDARPMRPAGELSETVPDHCLDTRSLRLDMELSEPPAYFALYDLSTYTEQDVADFREGGLPDLVGAEEVVAWGLEFPGYAVSVLPNLYTGEIELRLHPNAEAANRFFSSRGPLELSYLPLAAHP